MLFCPNLYDPFLELRFSLKPMRNAFLFIFSLPGTVPGSISVHFSSPGKLFSISVHFFLSGEAFYSISVHFSSLGELFIAFLFIFPLWGSFL